MFFSREFNFNVGCWFKIWFNTIFTKIVENCPDSYLKFVINPETWENDIQEIREILEEIPYFMNVYLMPLGQNKDELLKNTQFVMEKCVENGFSFSNRNHILAWNDKPGV